MILSFEAGRALVRVMTKVAVGARRPVGDEEAGRLHFNGLAGDRTKVRVELNGWDLYDMELIRIGADISVTVLASADDVYVDDLGEVVYSLCREREVA